MPTTIRAGRCPADSIGQDRLGQPDATTVFEQPEGWVALDVTTLLQHQHSRPDENFGFLLAIGGLNQRSAYYEALSADHPDLSLRPLLRVRYVVDPALPTLTPTPVPTYTPGSGSPCARVSTATLGQPTPVSRAGSRQSTVAPPPNCSWAGVTRISRRARTSGRSCASTWHQCRQPP
ncbi:MAG: hypothetical protein HZY76_16785 [Anaerolineae bacterium]|nr:MAG: hypothetical protein HZY76_16785 [Anaerolineae bacterium]